MIWYIYSINNLFETIGFTAERRVSRDQVWGHEVPGIRCKWRNNLRRKYLIALLSLNFPEIVYNGKSKSFRLDTRRLDDWASPGCVCKISDRSLDLIGSLDLMFDKMRFFANVGTGSRTQQVNDEQSSSSGIEKRSRCEETEQTQLLSLPAEGSSSRFLLAITDKRAPPYRFSDLRVNEVRRLREYLQTW